MMDYIVRVTHMTKTVQGLPECVVKCRCRHRHRSPLLLAFMPTDVALEVPVRCQQL